jgi:hypothetical protein
MKNRMQVHGSHRLSHYNKKGDVSVALDSDQDLVLVLGTRRFGKSPLARGRYAACLVPGNRCLRCSYL